MRKTRWKREARAEREQYLVLLSIKVRRGCGKILGARKEERQRGECLGPESNSKSKRKKDKSSKLQGEGERKLDGVLFERLPQSVPSRRLDYHRRI